MPRPHLTVLALIMAGLLPLPAKADGGQAGAYLAARQASIRNDFAEAAKWFDRVLLSDPNNPALLEGAVAAHLAVGQITEAATIGRVLLTGGTSNQIASLAVLTAHAQSGDFNQILTDLAAGNTIGAVIDRLMAAWAKIGTGNITTALADFDAIIATPGTGAFGIYHKALALASSGDFEGADRLLSTPDAAPALQLRRAVLAQVQILSQLERNTDAIALIDRAFGTRLDPGMFDTRRRLLAGETLAFDIVRNAADGMAEVFFTLATALNDQADQTYILLYIRAAAALRPDHVEAQLTAAGILDKLERFELAIEALDAVPATDPAFASARIGQADAAIMLGRTDDAVAILKDLVALKPEDISAQTALGDALHRQDRCDLAILAYSAAIALVPEPAPDNWPLFYKRAGCEFQNDNWPDAEADFRRALALAPDEPRLLNELGYSYVDRGENLAEALDMIQRAVAASPETGYIVDSLAWAYFRLGRFAEAVAPQEKASRLMPVDPIVTDHLGDIYWMVGRKREAQFQWRRALSFDPVEEEKPRIQRKIEVGLDVVLQEEEAAKSNGN